MAARTSVRLWRGSHGLTSALVYAVLEWLLIFLLFLDALFSYLVTKFANFCELQTPCLLCSRIDHIIGCEKPGCLFSFATEKKSNAETYRSLVAKLGLGHMCCDGTNPDIHPKLNLEGDSSPIGLHGDKLLEDPLLKDAALESPGTKHCSCCDGSFRTIQQFHHRLFQFKSIASGTTELDDAPSSILMEEDSFSHWRHGLKKKNRKSYGLAAVSNLGSRGFDSLSHVGYSELNITSGSESEVPISDDDGDDNNGNAITSEAGTLVDEILDRCIHPKSGRSDQIVLPRTLSADGNAVVGDAGALESEILDQCVQPVSGSIDQNVLPGTLSADLSEEKLIHQTPMLEPSIPVPYEQLNAVEPLDISPLPSAVAVGHGLEELNRNQIGESGTLPVRSEIISSHAASSSANMMEAPIEDFGKFNLEIDTACVSSSESKAVKERESGPASAKTAFNQTIVNEQGPSISSCMDLNEAYQLAVGNNGCQLSDSELPTRKDSTQIQEDLKVLLSQLSAARGFEFSWSDMSPRVNVHADDLKISGGYSFIGQQMLNKRISIERNESGFESLDGSIVSEIEGESEVDRLKRQIELDRKSMSALYKELEEERSASTIAANQAMAMITRLQEEKATMQMEALQYQRMMEEQAEYDQEALQKLSELLSHREKEIQSLEEELVTYRRFQNESTVEKVLGPVTDMKEDCSHLPCSGYENNTTFIKFKDIDSSDQTRIVNGDYEGNKVGSLKDSLIDFEDEKLHITKCFKRLEKMLHRYSNNGVYVDISELDDRDDHLVMGFDKGCPITLKDNADRNGGFSEAEVPEGMVHLPCNGMTQEINQMELEEDFSLQKHPTPCKEDPHEKPSCNSQFIVNNNHNGNCEGPHFSLACRDNDFVALGMEVSRLNESNILLEPMFGLGLKGDCLQDWMNN
ncbi:hypothetical protein MRB53_003417 [Persea americana]|uniref:Uncharacterized protein n=1 Tax=Persea americana TaxID=3435 RepID=A0ACC2MXJ1_PERAE|nr:hypothetical protein MRB53_003417 [Persea americana]